jgi:hypothetical protein
VFGVEMKTGLFFFALSLASFVAVFFIPDFQRTEIYNSAVNLDEYILNDVVNPSLYKETARSGDTTPTLKALYHAVRIHRESSRPVSNEKRVKDFLSTIEDNLETTEQIFQYVSVASFLRSLNPTTNAKCYNKLLHLIEPASGFKPHSGSGATVTASWQAFEAISFLGVMDEFKTLPKFDSVIRFVRSTKNATGGYSEAKRKDATLSATYNAYQLLSKYDHIQETDTTGVLDFIYSCQSADGGFLEHVVSTNFEKYYESGSLETTAHALLTHLRIAEVDLHSLLMPMNEYGLYNAISFLRHLVSTEMIKSHSTDYYGSISATDELITLVNTYHALNIETPRSLQVGLLGASIFFFSLGVYNLFRVSLAKVKNFDCHHVVSGASVLLLLTALTLKTFPHLVVIPFVFLIGFLLKVLFTNLDDLFKTGEDTVLALALGGSAIYAIFPFGAAYFSPLAFTHMSLYYILVLWSGVGAFVSFIVAKQFLLNTKAQNFYFSATTISWILNTILLYSLLYSR